jgi:hypothetical protein
MGYKVTGFFHGWIKKGGKNELKSHKKRKEPNGRFR